MSKENSDYRRLIKPVLNVLKANDDYHHIDEVSETLVDLLGISAQEYSQKLPSGRQTVFQNDLLWALSYLEQDRLIETDNKNKYRITNSGKRFLITGTTSPDSTGQVPHKFFGYPENSPAPAPETELSEDAANQDNDKTYAKSVIAENFETLYRQLKKDVLDKVHAQSPSFFENLIIDLLLSMGYGQRRHDLQAHLGRSGDGGIDGAINQDQLGLDKVYIQAKRYRPGLSVPVSAIRDFAGSLEAHKANKGVFVTTSHFTKSSNEFIGAVSRRIVLIDGERLSSLLIRNNIGVKVSETYEIKRLDDDYFQ